MKIKYNKNNLWLLNHGTGTNEIATLNDLGGTGDECLKKSDFNPGDYTYGNEGITVNGYKWVIIKNLTLYGDNQLVRYSDLTKVDPTPPTPPSGSHTIIYLIELNSSSASQIDTTDFGFTGYLGNVKIERYYDRAVYHVDNQSVLGVDSSRNPSFYNNYPFSDTSLTEFSGKYYIELGSETTTGQNTYTSFYGTIYKTSDYTSSSSSKYQTRVISSSTQFAHWGTHKDGSVYYRYYTIEL